MTTTSDQAAVPPCRGETWKPVPEIDGCTYSGYEASDQGRYRSVDRTVGNRRLAGKVLSIRHNDDGYVLVNIRCDNPDHKGAHTHSGHKVTLYTFAGPPESGEEACHSERGPAFNWWPEGVRWDCKPANTAERTVALNAAGRSANGGRIPEPKSPAVCVRCGGRATKGRRCHECVVAIGMEAAGLLRAGVSLEEANERLEYASAVYLHVLAVKYGGWGTCPTCSQPATEPAPVTFRERLSRAVPRALRHGS